MGHESQTQTRPLNKWLLIVPIGCLALMLSCCVIGGIIGLIMDKPDSTDYSNLDSTKVLTPEFFSPVEGTTLEYKETNYVMDRPGNVFNTSVSKVVCSKFNTLEFYPYPVDMPETIGFVIEIRIVGGFVQFRRGSGGVAGVETKWNRVLKIGAKPGDTWNDAGCRCKYRLMEIAGRELPTATIEVIKETKPDDDVSTSLFPLEPNLGGDGSKFVLEFQVGKGLVKCESFLGNSQSGWIKNGSQRLISTE